MRFIASNVTHLLDKRLLEARLELLEDSRIHRALHQAAEEDEDFIRQLVVEKLAAAAQHGFEAAEATLRVQAGEYLIQAGIPAEQQRTVLNEATAPLQLNGKQTARPGNYLWLSSIYFPGAILAVWTVFSVLWYLKAGLAWPVLAALLLLGVLVSAVSHRVAGSFAAQQKSRLARELPASVCRLYQQELIQAVRRFEEKMNETAASRG